MGDPNPEDEVEAASAAEPAAKPSVDDFQPVAIVRYRAAFEGAEDPVLVVSDCSEGVHVRGIMMGEVWRWVDKTVEDLQPRAVTAVIVAATVHPYNQHKGDRRQEVLVRDDFPRYTVLQYVVSKPLLEDLSCNRALNHREREAAVNRDCWKSAPSLRTLHAVHQFNWCVDW
jgi:hypothetical protein